MSREHDDVPRAGASLALRRVQAARARLWLVRPDLGEAAAALGLLLLHHLPGLVGALGAAIHRHG